LAVTVVADVGVPEIVRVPLLVEEVKPSDNPVTVHE
jgi:hypothetical protein